jgi:chemotaxis signal transduction protein
MGQAQWFCLFRGDAGPMAVPAESVAEVLETDNLVRLAWSPPQVVGLCPYHQEVIPVVRLVASRIANADPSSEPDPTAGAETSGEKHGVDDRTRCILLILRTEQGAWGIPSDSAWTIMSRGCPEYHPPHTDGDGPVLVGTVLHAGARYGILDTEATWHGLRSAIGRWYGLIGEP